MELHTRGLVPAVLESDVLRPILVGESTYSEVERDEFYHRLAELGALLHRQGVDVVFDATASLRRHRQHARDLIPELIEVLVDCSLETCMARDPKGIYARARLGAAHTVPGAQTPYEPPGQPALVVDAEHDAPEVSARRVVACLEARGLVRPRDLHPRS
jgi:adenylylsulfate kinase-like enzyme